MVPNLASCRRIGNNDLIVIEKVVRSLRLLLRAALPEQLVNGLRDCVFDLWRFTFDDHDRQTIEKQDDVRNNVMLCAQDAHLELAHSNEAIVVSMGEVHKARTVVGFSLLSDCFR